MTPQATSDGNSDFDTSRALAALGVDTLHAESDNAVKASLLARLYPEQTITDTEVWRMQFWSQCQREAKPTLIFQPTSAKEVAIAVLVCRQTQTRFAVKSGGHAPMQGASSIDGVVIDLKKLNGVELNEDKSIARIGTGAYWVQVFEELAKDGLAVAGGRVADVGVGGYTLGGGISFFASARGWACDNVRNYELVLSTGEILNVNYTSHPDLFWALRGGGSSVGIVTRFDFETFPQGDIYAGNLAYDSEHKEAVVKAFSKFAHSADPKAATWLAMTQKSGKVFFSALSMYASPTADNPLANTYSAIPALYSSHKIRSMADMVHEIKGQQIQDHRQSFWNHTFKFDADFVAWIVDEYVAEMGTWAGAHNSSAILQYFTKESVSCMNRDGGNCLPLREDEAPYLNFLIASSWKYGQDDEAVLGGARAFMDKAVQEAKKRGLYVEFVYMNYGSYYQDVLKSYGESNYERLREVAIKHDPEGVFQKLMPGYYKFGGAPAEADSS